MPRKIVGNFKVEYLQILDEKGKVDKNLEPQIPDADLKKMYEVMLLARMADAKSVNLQRTGRLATFAPSSGQEAAQVASAILLKETDWMVPAFREQPALLMRGLPLNKIFQWMKGIEEAMQGDPKTARTLPVSIPVGSQMVHATGIAYAIKLDKKKDVVLTYFGDGATSEGEFHGALNFAGVWQAPVIFLCQNNQWAISMPREKQTHAKTLAQKAIAAGFEGIQVDGNDVLAVYVATKQAIEKARAGKGPTLIEAVTYRQLMHTTADDPKKYRKPEEEEYWMKRDPIPRYEKYLKSKKLWTEKYKKQLEEKLQKEIEEAAEKMDEEVKKLKKPENIFNYVYAEMDSNLKEQLDYLKEILNEKEQGAE